MAKRGARAINRLSGDVRKKLRAKWTHCHWCGRELVKDQSPPHHAINRYTVDHIIAVAEGGSNRMNNLVPSCYGCNQDRDRERKKDKKAYWQAHAALARADTKGEGL